MELRQLRYFESVVTYGTIRETAARLFMCESTISEQIKELQKEIGFPLFEKQGRKIVLTAEGKQVLPLAKAILADVKDFEAGISEINNPGAGLIKLGVVSVARLDIVPKKIMEFAQVSPDIQIEIMENGALEIIEYLLNDKVDFALISTNSRIKSILEASAIQYKVLSNVGSVALVSCNHPLANQDKILLNQLADERIILRRQGIYREAIINSLRDSITKDRFYTIDTYETALQLVELNLGITIIPEAFIGSLGLQENSKVKLLLLDDFQIQSDMCFIYKKKRYRPLYFINFMRIFTDSVC
ncbi:LysR family transcriptional regulator [Desulfosporosinus sp. PR]|uniref:LysR family transcriptional regulator n=1 Tax=Candidatus Desulfosporosinus nitrosoreducens TaxID=3401928 RepID=UPI0027E7EB74|nr:LysR family transcriptional regulator [Desulfosporosinus sp. PR]MDQ7093563.1 LysR family transcriptional regulator [Desulfosporosinus sp. PR]